MVIYEIHDTFGLVTLKTCNNDIVTSVYRLQFTDKTKAIKTCNKLNFIYDSNYYHVVKIELPEVI